MYDSKDGAYYLQLDVEVDMPTAILGEEILAHVKPTSSSPTRDNFEEVPISQIRELGHSGTAAWQTYRTWNKWQKTKHRAVYFVRAEKTALGLPLPSSVEGPNGDSMFMNGLNANAPEFTPSSSAPSPPSDSGGADRRSSIDDQHTVGIGRCLLPSEVAALLGDDCLHHEEAFDSDLSCSPIGHPLHQHVDYHDGWRTRMPFKGDSWVPLGMDGGRSRLTSAAESSTTSSSLATANESPYMVSMTYQNNIKAKSGFCT
ncbi:hypothetical protein Pmar_PMAR019510 [Perkinsus marinus ATCC 50983]|uniref:Uncharacterized protein n=1 Tax=Perkinsus marinus (strain ATCC 50983 / TXsc) TaxID=423536 RepID=C5KR80_PERM5|nr:hypothetical protein Pmar_PMAR019510 [Perkinsus marinus ATCC 50983]EER12981.1 hypothetical protein Pmar_PMAR019510 [Perkinsus marinus ATCC 50983]|eukprot:XP_002781186.1 hypothetical protein Pmar_PMAR019510 [Perkinsus marinus ATCC 50983]